MLLGFLRFIQILLFVFRHHQFNFYLHYRTNNNGVTLGKVQEYYNAWYL